MNLIVHGCLLRVERPGECRSYLADPRFQKRADAKAAVCLQAMSLGVGNYIRELGTAVATKVSHFRTLANQYILPQLASECEKTQPGNRPVFTFEMDRDGKNETFYMVWCLLSICVSLWLRHESGFVVCRSSDHA